MLYAFRVCWKPLCSRLVLLSSWRARWWSLVWTLWSITYLCFIKIWFWRFFLFFCLNIFLCFFMFSDSLCAAFCILDKTPWPTVSCRRTWTLLISLTGSYLSLTLLWLCKPPLFLVAPGVWGCQCPRGKDRSRHRDAGWWEAGPSGSSRESRRLSPCRRKLGWVFTCFLCAGLGCIAAGEGVLLCPLKTVSSFATVLGDLQMETPLDSRAT